MAPNSTSGPASCSFANRVMIAEITWPIVICALFQLFAFGGVPAHASPRPLPLAEAAVTAGGFSSSELRQLDCGVSICVLPLTGRDYSMPPTERAGHRR